MVVTNNRLLFHQFKDFKWTLVVVVVVGTIRIFAAGNARKLFGVILNEHKTRLHLILLQLMSIETR